MRSLGAWLALLILAGCASSAATQAVWDAISLSRSSGVSGAVLDPNFKYLRLTVNGRESFLARGYVDPAPGGEVEVWYGGRGEVLKLQNGRVAALLGPEIEWLSVKYANTPTWLEATKGEACYSRQRDEAPGYRYGLVETLCLSPSEPPRRSQLLMLDPAALQWFEERTAAGVNPPPGARYAYSAQADQGRGDVLYSEFCLKEGICLSWQRWDAQQGAVR